MMSAFRLGRYSDAIVPTSCSRTTAVSQFRYGRRRLLSSRTSNVPPRVVHLRVHQNDANDHWHIADSAVVRLGQNRTVESVATWRRPSREYTRRAGVLKSLT